MNAFFLKVFAIALCTSTVISEECKPWGVERRDPDCFYPKGTKESKVACIGAPNVNNISWGNVRKDGFRASWTPISDALCYRVDILKGYTIRIAKTIPCHRGATILTTGLNSGSVYGIIVRAVDRYCNEGPPGRPARTRTSGETTKRTTTTIPTETPPPKDCGRGFFTCHSDRKECVRNKLWCNRQLDCSDGSDERACPGGCEEIDIEFKNGNYSCTRYGSPRSVCSFDCNLGYERDGYKRTQCLRRGKKWSRPIPTCRLPATTSLKVLNEESTETEITVQWEPIIEALKYSLLVVEKPATKGEKNPLTKIESIDVSKCCKTVIGGLLPGTEFIVTMRAIDAEGVDGHESAVVLGRTAAKTGE